MTTGLKIYACVVTFVMILGYVLIEDHRKGVVVAGGILLGLSLGVGAGMLMEFHGVLR